MDEYDLIKKAVRDLNIERGEAYWAVKGFLIEFTNTLVTEYGFKRENAYEYAHTFLDRELSKLEPLNKEHYFTKILKEYKIDPDEFVADQLISLGAKLGPEQAIEIFKTALIHPELITLKEKAEAGEPVEILKLGRFGDIEKDFEILMRRKRGL